MAVVAIIQARMGSSRLPGKVLLPLDLSRTALECMIDRTKQSRLIDRVVVATTEVPVDDAIADLLEAQKLPYVRGSESDVLARYWQAAQAYAAPGDVIVRLTSDCPVIDPRVIDKVIGAYQEGGYDFVSNSLEPYSYPDGMDVEVFSYELLERAAREAVLPSHREHVTFYFWQQPDLFFVRYIKSDIDLTRHRVTLDYPEDYELLKRVYEHFSPRRDFSLEEIIVFLEAHPDAAVLDGRVVRNAGWKSALEKDEQFKKSTQENDDSGVV